MLRKIIALVIALILTISVIPTAVFADVSVNNVTLLQSNAQSEVTNNKLTVTSVYSNTTLQTAFEGDAFATRKNDNLVANAVSVKAQVTLDSSAMFEHQRANLYDGIINENSTDAPTYGATGGLNGTNPQGYITVALDGKYDISNFYIIGHHNSTVAIRDYEVYVSNDESTLYNDDNLVATFKYSGYQDGSSQSTVGKLNGTGLSEGQIFSFNGETKPQGKYIGFKLNDASGHSSYPYFLHIAELGIEGNVLPGQLSGKNVTITDIADETIKSKLSVAARVPTQLKTQFKVDAFKGRNKNNLIKNALEFAMYTSAEQTTQVTQSGAVPSWSQKGMCDGEIAHNIDGQDKEGTRLTGTSSPLDQKYGYFTIELNDSYPIGDIYIASRENGTSSLMDYEVYVSETRDDLYAEENLVVDYLYTGYTARNVGKLNNETIEGATESYIAEVQDFAFSEPTIGRYVGIKMNSFNKSNDGYNRIYEIGIEEFKYFRLDESAINDETIIRPTKGYTEQGVDYTFKVEMKNGNTLEKLYLDGVEITPDADGIYTVKNANASMKLTAKTTRDEFAPVDGVWTDAKGKKWNLKKKSDVRDALIWDSDVQFFETASFWEGEPIFEFETRLSTKLLYPIDEIIKVQSYDLATTYYEGEDFEIINGEFHLTENSRIPVYGRGEGETLRDLAVLKEDGNVFWSSDKPGNRWWSKTFWKYQICITYKHSTVWNESDIYTKAPESKLSKIQDFHEKALSGEPTNVLFIGSSNVVGHVASNMGAPETFRVADSTPGDGTDDQQAIVKERTPETCADSFSSKYTPEELEEWGGFPWRQQVENGLTAKYGDNITFTNCAVSSSSSEWHKKHMQYLYGEGEGTAGTPTPDLVIIATGGNEQGRDGAAFVANFKPVIELLKSRNPDCCFVFVNGLYINRRTTDGTLSTFKMLDQEAECLKVETGESTVITDNKNIISVPNYSFYKSLSNNKTVVDAIGDVLNHPNDFGHNAIANLVLATLGVYDDCDHSANNTYVVGKKTATCSTPGYTGDTYCNDCGELISKGTNVSCPRSSTTVKNKKTATCTAKGYTGDTYCNTCGELVKKGTATNVVAHKSVTKVTKATLSKNGKITYTCSVCKKATKSSTTVYYPKTIKLSTTTYTYNGKTKKPTVKVTDSKGKTISSSNYTVSYAGGRKYPGKYKVTVKFKGNYEGTKTLYFTVKPKKASLSSVKSTSKKKMTVKWSKQSGVTGYEILLATNSKFTKGKKTVTVKGSSSKSKTIKSLKSKKTYYVKVRAYKTIDGKKVYGSYSKYKKVKVK